MYYIDLNGAYLSCINNIPTGKPDKNYEFEGKNTKIKELLEKLYDIRIKLKKGVFEDFKEDPILANNYQLKDLKDLRKLSLKIKNNL